MTYVETSNTTVKDLDDTLNYIITVCVGLGAWHGSMEGFILHWDNEVAHYNKHATSPIGDDQRCIYLEHAVSDLPDLACVKKMAKTMNKVNPQIVLNTGSYLRLLIDAA